MTKAKITFCNEQKLIQEEKERLRKLRIIQVREISKQTAANLREAFRNEKEKEIRKIIHKQETVKKQEHEEEFNEIKQLVQREIDIIGQGHLSAANYDDGIELRQRQAIENEERAALRGRTAILVEKEERNEIENKENAHIIARKMALEQEKIRAAKIARLPKPKDDQIENVVNKKSSKLVSLHDVDVFMTTRYHMPETLVNRPSIEEMDTFDARQSAIDEEMRQKSLEKEHKRQSNERNEKARLRGKHALEKEILTENYNDILKELNMLEQADREKRQKELMNIPKEIFVPSWQREQDKNEFQLELERQFEKIYVDTNMRKEEMPLPVDIKKLEISQSNLEEDTELDLTVLNDEQHEPIQVEPILNEKQHFIVEKTAVEQQKQPSPKPLSDIVIETKVDNKESTVLTNVSKNQSTKESFVLNKLLDKIKKQREESAQKSSTIENNISIDDSTASEVPTSDKEVIVNEVLEETLVEEKSANKSKSLEEYTITESESTESSEELSYTLSLNSNTPKSDVGENQNRTGLNSREKKLIRGIMMSSHNVSSVNELALDHNRLILQSKMSSNQAFRNTAQSVDLSHASRDPMVAGSKELFNKNDVKLAIELKQKQLQKQQSELEEKLRKLVEQQTELEQQTTKEKSKSDQNKSNTESNNSLTLSHSIESTSNKQEPNLNEDDLKRIEYQKRLLTITMNKKEEKSNEDRQFDKLIEDRKKEIQKKFGIEIQSSSSSSLNTVQEQVIVKNKPPIATVPTDDKHTIYSGDSGFVSSSNNYNMNLRNQQPQIKKPINIAVEQLNKEILNAASKPNILQTELINLLNGQITEEEYLRRLSLISNQSDSSILSNEQISRLFGLEFYDSNNFSDVRDASIEKIIGWGLQLKGESNEPRSKSSGLFTKTNTSSSSNDTLNDQSSNEFSDQDDSSSDDGQSLIMSLLKCNNKNLSQKSREMSTLDMKKQFIQEQLDMVRRQKDQLESQQIRAFNSGSLPPPVKFNKFVNDVNPHELSTIKEVDTPISERNVKLTNTNRHSMNNVNKSSINLTTVSDLSSSSLENVTQLNESNQIQTSRTAQNCFSYGLSAINSAISPSTSLFCTTIAEENLNQFQQNQNYLMNTTGRSDSKSFTSTSTPITQTSNPKNKINLDELRKNQKQLLNISLFDSSNQSSQSSKSNSPNQTQMKKVQYGELIFDSLATNNLSVSQQTLSQTTLSNSSFQKPVAFKTESTINTSELFKKFNLNSNNNNNNSLSSVNNKKWFDILASTDEEKSITQRKLSTSSLSQGPLPDDTDNEEGSILHSLIEAQNRSSLMSASPSVLINSFGSNKAETFRDLEPVNEAKDLKSCSFTSQISNRSDGMFDRFLKNYSGPSVMDEPEISFVSYKTTSNPVSPRTAQNLSDFSSNSTKQSSDSSSLSLIKFQQKQLSKQFANMSPIDHQASSLSSTQMKKSFSTTIPFETTSMFSKEQNSSIVEGQLSQEEIEERLQINYEKTLLCDSNNQSIGSAKKSESLLSFENHEFTQLTPMNKKSDKSSLNTKSFVQSVEDLQNSTIVSLKETTTKSSSRQSPIWNSTPMISNSDLKFMTNHLQDSCTFDKYGDNTNDTASLIYFDESANLSVLKRRKLRGFLNNPTCKTCSYCRSFYSVLDNDQDKNHKIKIEKKNFVKKDKLSKDLAKNVTQEFYYVNFDGKKIDLNVNDLKYALQKSCQNHLKKIRRKPIKFKSKIKL